MNLFGLLWLNRDKIVSYGTNEFYAATFFPVLIQLLIILVNMDYIRGLRFIMEYTASIIVNYNFFPNISTDIILFFIYSIDFNYSKY